MSKLIRTKFDDSTCVRCGKEFDKGDLVLYAKPFGVWCEERCIPEFEPPTGALAQAIEVLERLEEEGRLKGYTQGMLDRYRLVGRLSDKHIASVLPAESEVVRRLRQAAGEQLNIGQYKCPACDRRQMVMMLDAAGMYGQCKSCGYADDERRNAS